MRGLVTAGGAVAAAREGDEVELVLDRTPFYAEGGGQLADQGVIELDERRPARGARRAVAGHRADRAPGAGARRRGHAGRSARTRGSTSSGARRSRARTPRTHMVHKAFREALGETATQAGLRERAGPVPLRLLRDRRRARVGDGRRRGAGQRRWCSPTCASTPRYDARPRRWSRARWRSSARSTATRCASSRWATGRASSAAAPTRAAPASSASIKLLGESSIGSGVRRVEALVGGDAYRFLAREHVLVAQLSEALKVRPERAARAGARHRRAAPRGGEGDREGPRRSSCCSPVRSSPRSPPGRSREGRRAPRRRRGRAATSAQLALDVRGRLPGGRARGRGRGGRRRRQGRGRGGGQRRGARAWPVGQRAGARGRSAGRRQGRRQGRRGAGRRNRRVPGRRGAARSSRPRSAGRSRLEVAGVRLGLDPGDVRVGRRAQRPVRHPGHPGRDGDPRQGRPGPDRGARSPRRVRVEIVVGLPRSLSGGEGPAAAKVREFAGALAGVSHPCRSGFSTSD